VSLVVEQRPAWLAEVIDAAVQWYEAAGGDKKSGKGRPTKIGPVNLRMRNVQAGLPCHCAAGPLMPTY
jgi:hypothetical protein